MTVAQLNEEMSNQEFVEWQALYALRAQRQEMEQLKAARRGR